MVYEQILKYCEEENISLSEFEKRCKIGNGTVGKWKDGKTSPTIKTLNKISIHTDITIGYWLGGMS